MGKTKLKYKKTDKKVKKVINVSKITQNNVPWIESYRPYNISNLIVDKSIKKEITKMIEEKEVPHLIITGQPGIGKTSTLLCIARELLGKYFEEGFLELNGSDERGIKTNDAIETFCTKKIGGLKPKKGEEGLIKIVLIDEADNLTPKAQNQINALISQFEKNTRFAFTCNTSSKIIRAIQSRCTMIRYKRLDKETVAGRLKFICKNEKVNYEESAIMKISSYSNGDLRKGINFLQNLYNSYGRINLDEVHTLYDRPEEEQLSEIFNNICKQDYKSAIGILTGLFDKAYSGSDLIIAMINLLKDPDYKELNEETKNIMMDTISKYMFKSAHGLDNKIQLSACISKMYLDYKNRIKN